MPEVVWRGNEFSMRPIDPAAAGDNPVTRVLNMVLRGNREVRKRHNFNGDPLVAFDNAIVGHIGGADRLVVKRGTAITPYVLTANGSLTAGTSLNDPLADIPIGAVTDAARGSFAIANGELYYADENTIFAWDGNTAGDKRRPGVPTLDDLDYVDMTLNKTPIGLSYAGYGPPFGPPANHPGQAAAGKEVWTTDWSPYIVFSDSLTALGSGDPPDVGSKLLNTSFAFSWYDPKRRIFGRRSRAFALPYLFAGGPKPPANLSLPDLLSSARAQYAKVVTTPDSTVSVTTAKYEGRKLGNGRTDLQAAIWFSRGFLPAANTAETIDGGWWAISVWAPAMSVGMNELLFLEKIEDQNRSNVNCGKDDASLYASGRYLDQYARPVPCRFMTILPNGTGLYFYPRIPDNRRVETAREVSDPPNFAAIPGPAPLSLVEVANAVEHSVGHPETIGRNTNELRDTASPIPFLSGEIIATIPSGMFPLLLTTQGIHRVGFDRGVVITEVSSTKGVVAPKSYQHTSSGDFWYSHEGVIWKRGEQMIVLDEELGFSDWFDDLPYDERDNVSIGVAESESQVIISLPSGPNRALCYDYAKKFASEFSSEAAFTDAIYFGGKLRTPGGNYPGPGIVTADTEITAWISEDVNRPKQLKWVELKLGKAGGSSGTVNVTVTAFDHPDTEPEYAGTAISKTASVAISTSAGKRVRLEDFLGMRGRMFKITIEGASTGTDWGIQELRCEYAADEQADARSV